jgi:transposase-like protein
MRPRLHRLLKPRSPENCPACRLASSPSSVVGSGPTPVRPWREVKSRRGAPKRVNTKGFACPNKKCPYFGSTDDQIHALVGDGKHGQAEQIQTFRGPACRTTFTARRDTPLYRLKTPSQQVGMVLSALAEGLDPSAAERVFGFRHATITRWLTRAGGHAHTLHERFFCHLWLPHLQLDELRTRLRCSQHVLWLWLVIDPCTKLLPVLHLGPRTQHMAHRVIHSLRQLLAPGCLPVFTSDGLNLYFYALTAHFGEWIEVWRRGRNVRQWQVAAGLIYGQVKKSYRRRKLTRVTPMMRLGTEDALKIALQSMGFGGAAKHGFHRAGSTDGPTWDSCAGSSHLGHGSAVPTSAGSPGMVASVLPFCASSPIAARRARAATSARGQVGGATLLATDTSHGRRENHSTMDGARGALLPLAAGFRLRATTVRCGRRSMSWGGW